MIVMAERQKPAAVAFGNVFDLARLRGRPAEAEVCEACRTINPHQAFFCKGCDGKLPAYFAAVEAGAPVMPAVAAGDDGDRDERRSRLTLVALVVLWGTVTAVAALQVHGPRPLDPGMASSHSPQQVVVQAVAGHVAPEGIALAAAEEHAAVAGHPAPSLEVPREPAVTLTARERTDPGERADPQSSRKATPAPARPVRSLAAGLLARCEGRNFFSRAVCMNNLCARPEARRSSQCAETLRQARLGEARRNPQLAS
ncbi:hypothetical protein GCM10023165_54800 [Variovorax defluvii]|uniref:Zinc ribbon domain-containing protein n=2 Tax=Variovorax defluvii TaxID=913761 RepID=A0ABP8IHS3_9BURK